MDIGSAGDNLPPPPPPEPSHEQPVLDKFFKSVLREMNPIAWVTETSKQKRWFVHGVESSKGTLKRRTFFYTVTINDMTTVGRGPKKKEAKADAFKQMAIKLGEYLCYLPLLPKPKVEQPSSTTAATTTTDAAAKVTKEGVKGPLEAAPVTSVYTAPGAAVPGAALSAYDDIRAVPDRIRVFTAHEVAQIEGHPVIALNDVCKKLLYRVPQYACVKEEVVGKIGIYSKMEYTTRVAVTKGQENKMFYGVAATKKESKNQAAVAGYFGITGLGDVLVPEPTSGTSTSHLTKLVRTTTKIQDKVSRTIQQQQDGGSKIAVLGSAVPLPAPATIAALAPATPAIKSNSLTDKVHHLLLRAARYVPFRFKHL